MSATGPDTAEWGALIAAVRAFRGLAQGTIASRARISQATLSRLETGTRRPSPHVCVAVEEALGIRDHAELLELGLVMLTVIRRRESEMPKS